MKKGNIIVGMSGGVDSSVAAWLLQQQGYNVSGLFMKNWEEDDTDQYCSAAVDMADAQAVCDQLNIHLHKVNFASEYWDNVFSHFLTEYSAGRTPNPDILCNKYIKFKAFLDFALELGADYIATGHYARCEQRNDQYLLLKGLDNAKDQSYFLHLLDQQQLSKSIFPLGSLTKPEVRAIAAEQGFPNHNKKDSTGICFIGERKFKDFLQTYLPALPGPILTIDNELIGQHDGLMYYTIGQRQGIGIGGLANKPEQPWYVVDKDLSNNTLIIAQGDDAHLYKKTLHALNVHWISGTIPEFPLPCRAKIRYRQPDQACVISPGKNGCLRVDFSEAQRAITPGQSVVFYQEDICLGGGIIL
jgi:tRNA-specific 2-thiouridylase